MNMKQLELDHGSSYREQCEEAKTFINYENSENG